MGGKCPTLPVLAVAAAGTAPPESAAGTAALCCISSTAIMTTTATVNGRREIAMIGLVLWLSVVWIDENLTRSAKIAPVYTIVVLLGYWLGINSHLQAAADGD